MLGILHIMLVILITLSLYFTYINIYMSIYSNHSQNLAPETPEIQVFFFSNAPVTKKASTAPTDLRTFFSLPTRFEDSLELNLEGELKYRKIYVCV